DLLEQRITARNSFHGGKERDVAILKTKRWNCGACKQLMDEV
nr:hypothetical protein [Tanacetum cinerariifolium]